VELSKADIKLLSRFFRDEEKLNFAVKGKLKQYLDEYFNLYHNGKAFVFTPASKAKLRADIELLFPRLNLRQGLPSGLSRVAASQYVNDDKLADIKPNDSFLLAGSSNGRLVAFGREVILPLGGSLRLPVEGIDIGSLNTVIVIENLDVFDGWHLANIPSELKDALVLYRGHEGTITTGLKALLHKLPVEVEVFMFPDLDPKGLENCFTTPKVRGILAPSIAHIQKHLIQHSQATKFVHQQDAVTFLKKQEYGAWQSLISHLLNNNLAIMQQSIIALGLPLVCYLR
jgi:hypothetical protein